MEGCHECVLLGGSGIELLVDPLRHGPIRQCAKPLDRGGGLRYALQPLQRIVRSQILFEFVCRQDSRRVDVPRTISPCASQRNSAAITASL